MILEVGAMATRANTQPAFSGHLTDAYAPIAAIGMFMLTPHGLDRRRVLAR